jgi:hypothetical protein
MNTFKIIILAVIVAVFDNSCKNCIEGSGHEAVQTIQVDIFDKIEVDGTAKIIVQQGNIQEVKIVADDNLIEKIEFSVSRGRLHIENTECIKSYSQLSIYVTIPKFSELIVNGDAEVSTFGTFSVEDFDCDLNGSGTVKLSLIAEDIDTNIKGSVKLILEGQCDENDVTLDGSGSLDSYKMLARQLTLDLNGSGVARVSALEDLSIVINGSGTAYYKGKPGDLVTKITGTGKVLPQD